MSHIPLTSRKAIISDELTIRYLKKRLKRLNRLIKTADASPADYTNRDRVAFQLQDALTARRMAFMGIANHPA